MFSLANGSSSSPEPFDPVRFSQLGRVLMQRLEKNRHSRKIWILVQQAPGDSGEKQLPANRKETSNRTRTRMSDRLGTSNAACETKLWV